MLYDGNGNIIVIEGDANVTTGSSSQNVRSVNHRGYNTVAPENTLPAYILSKKKGFQCAECDVSFTSDGVAVLLHDDTIDRTSNGTGKISELTYEEVATLDFGSWKSEEYAGTKIPTFAEFIKLCKEIDLHPYIELKSGTQAQVEGIVAAVKAAGMKGKVTYISFSKVCLGYVKNVDPAARLGLVCAEITDTIIANAQTLRADTNEVFIDASYSAITDETMALCAAAGIPLEVWTINWESWFNNMKLYVSGVTSDSLVAGEILYKKNMT